MDFETILLGLALLVSLVVAIAAFVSKTMIWHPPFHSIPQKITWFGRMFMFLAGSIGMLQFGLAIGSGTSVSNCVHKSVDSSGRAK